MPYRRIQGLVRGSGSPPTLEHPDVTAAVSGVTVVLTGKQTGTAWNALGISATGSITTSAASLHRRCQRHGYCADRGRGWHCRGGSDLHSGQQDRDGLRGTGRRHFSRRPVPPFGRAVHRDGELPRS